MRTRTQLQVGWREALAVPSAYCSSGSGLAAAGTRGCAGKAVLGRDRWRERESCWQLGAGATSH